MDGWIELARAHTAAGDLLVLRERAGCVELRCNGWELMSNRAHHSEEALATLACAHITDPLRGQPAAARRGQEPDTCCGQHAAARRGPEAATLLGQPAAARCGQEPAALCNQQAAGVRRPARPSPIAPRLLLGGLGLGYTLRAALDRLPPTANIVVAELLPEIIAWNRGPLGRFAGHPIDDPRVSVACADVVSLLRAAPPASFHAILLDTDNGPDAVMLAGNVVLYRPDSLTRFRRALHPSGALAVWSADRSPQFERNLHDAGFHWCARDVPARGAPDDPLHTIYLAWRPA